MLGGLGDIDPGLVLGGYAAYQFGSVLFDASAGTELFGDDTGYQVRLGAETDYDVSDRLTLTARLGTTISGDEYMDAFFGVTAAQSAASVAGLPAYDPGAGFKDVHFELGTKFQVTDQWRLNVKGRYTRLIGDAADSPVIETENQFSGSLMLVYEF